MGVTYNPRIITDGLVLCLDAANSKSYSGSGTTWTDLSGQGNNFTLYNTPTYNTLGYFNLTGTNEYMVSSSTLDLSLANAVTVEVVLSKNNTSSGMIFEHTSNWNNQAGGFGFFPNSTGQVNSASTHHTNAFGFAPKNYTFQHDTDTYMISISWGWLDRVQTIFVDGQEVASASSVGSATSTFSNDYFYIGSRAGSSYHADAKIYCCKIYNRALTAGEVQQNFNAIRGRYGI